MVRIVAIVRPFRLPAVLTELREQGLVRHVHTQEVRGYGRQKDHLDDYGGDDGSLAFLPKIRLEVLVEELFTDQVMEAIARGARTGRIGDGKIFLLRGAPVAEV